MGGCVSLRRDFGGLGKDLLGWCFWWWKVAVGRTCMSWAYKCLFGGLDAGFEERWAHSSLVFLRVGNGMYYFHEQIYRLRDSCVHCCIALGCGVQTRKAPARSERSSVVSRTSSTPSSQVPLQTQKTEDIPSTVWVELRFRCSGCPKPHWTKPIPCRRAIA